jgi:hypothetical protein
MNRACVIGSFSILFFLFHYNGWSQQLVSTSGDFYANSTIQMEWSLGETIIESIGDGEILLTQGFHQSYLKFSDTVDNSIFVYPNPFDLYLFIDVPELESERMYCKIWDVTGRLIYDIHNLSCFNQVYTAEFAFGMYLVRIYDSKSRVVKTQKIIKAFIP